MVDRVGEWNIIVKGPVIERTILLLSKKLQVTYSICMGLYMSIENGCIRIQAFLVRNTMYIKPSIPADLRSMGLCMTTIIKDLRPSSRQRTRIL